MEAPSDDPTETLTGLGGTGVDLVLAVVDGAPLPSHPIVPVLQMSGGNTAPSFEDDLDLVPESDDVGALVDRITRQIEATAGRRYTPRLYGQGHTQFQLTRGLLGISL